MYSLFIQEQGLQLAVSDKQVHQTSQSQSGNGNRYDRYNVGRPANRISSGIHVVDEPVAVFSDGDDRRCTVLTVFTVGHRKGGGRAIGIGDGVGIHVAYGTCLFNRCDAYAVFTVTAIDDGLLNGGTAAIVVVADLDGLTAAIAVRHQVLMIIDGSNALHRLGVRQQNDHITGGAAVKE